MVAHGHVGAEVVLGEDAVEHRVVFDEGVAQPSMTQLVQRLERQGLVRRDRDPDDKRVVWVAITDAGRELLAARRRSRAAEMAELLATLPADDEAALAAAVLAALPVVRKLAERRADPGVI